MTKKELASKIVALEAQVALLQAQVAQWPMQVAPGYPQPHRYPYPTTFPTITCGGQVAEMDPHQYTVNVTGGPEQWAEHIKHTVNLQIAKAVA